MKNKLYYNQSSHEQAIKTKFAVILLGVLCFVSPVCVFAGDAPAWMHSLVNAPLPSHDEKTNAVLLYSEKDLSVQSIDKVRIVERRAYKILRPDGRDYGFAVVPFNSPSEKVTALRGWCIPATGKDYEVKDKEALEISDPKVDGSELLTDVKEKVIQIPASEPGNIVGYENEIEEKPFLLQDTWYFQGEVPAREAHYSLQLPAGWEYKAAYLNYSDIKPAQNGNQWEWTIKDIQGIREEKDMPPLHGVAATMVVYLFPPGGTGEKGFDSWQEMGNWYRGLTQGRRDVTPEMKQKVAELTTGIVNPLDKVRALANFVQHDIRYVAIELGIGGWQPHPAQEVFAHRYGDCKDKATLMSAMLQEIGVNSYYVVINSERGSITPEMPAYSGGFDHVILAITLPPETSDRSILATMQHPKLGTLLFFDPTNELTPFGQIGGYLQENYGLLVGPDGGQLVQLPKQPGTANTIRRTGILTLDANGNLSGSIRELRMGDRAWSERWRLLHVTNNAEQIKPIESLLSGSLSNFQITTASVLNLHHSDQPFGFNYSFQAMNYAKNAGDLLLVRPRVLGVEAQAIMETTEPRRFPIEFEGPVQDTDTFEITLPPGYQVDDLPPPVDADFGFASYHSKTEAKGNVIGYTRTFEIKDLSVPVSKAEDLKKFYRIIATDERNTAVLKAAK